jgi:glycopeptide antibiotics resistance protein
MVINLVKWRNLELNRTTILLIPVAGILAPMFFIGGPDYYSPRSYQNFWDLGHIIFFAIFTYLILSLWKNLANKSFLGQSAWIFAITLLLGVIVEIGQTGTGRSPNPGDLMRNFLGSALILFFWAPSRKKISKLKLRTLQLLAATIFVIGLLPLSAAVIDEWMAEKQFPVLSDFENPLEIYRWVGDAKFDISRNIASRGNSSIRIRLNTSMYSGVALKYFPADWKGYRTLEFSVYNPSSELLKITCRVHDRQHTRGPELYSDRFNRTYHLTQGWNPITVDIDELSNAPENRQMDISQIQGFGIFAVQLPQPKLIYLDYIRLSK